MLWSISEKNVMILPKGMWLVLYVCQFNWQSKINGCDKFGWQCNRNSIKPPTLLGKLFKHTCNQHTCIHKFFIRKFHLTALRGQTAKEHTKKLDACTELFWCSVYLQCSVKVLLGTTLISDQIRLQSPLLNPV